MRAAPLRAAWLALMVAIAAAGCSRIVDASRYVDGGVDAGPAPVADAGS